MKVLVAGSHGGIGRRLVPRLVDAGHEVVALIRDEAQADELRELGGEPLVADLEGDVAFATEGCDVVVFTAGAGPGSGAAKKETVDRQGAEKLVDAALEHGVQRYVMVSAMGASDPESGSEAMRPYLEAKAAADEYLAESGLQYTIVRPGGLTDEAGNGRVEAAESLGRRGQITRDDVAATLVAALAEEATISRTFELLDGDTPIGEALARL